MSRFIVLSTSDSDTSFYVNVDEITAMHVAKAKDCEYTIISYRSSTLNTWCVKETPEEILKLIDATQL